MVALGVGLKKWWLLCMWDLRNCCNLYVGLEKFWFLFCSIREIKTTFYEVLEIF